MKLSRQEIELPLMKIRKTLTPEPETSIEGSSLQAFEHCFEQYWASIYRLLERMLGDPSEAEDLALETFYRLYKRFPDPGDDFNVGGWLYRVATNLGLQSIRGLKRREHYEAAAGRNLIDESPESRPAEVLDEKEKHLLARLVLSKMDPRRSQLLVLRYSGMAYKDIARILKLSPTSIGPLLVRAEAEFKKRYRALTREDL